MVDKKQLNVHIPVELYNQIMDTWESKAHIVIETIRLYFDSNSYKSIAKRYNL